MTRPRSSSFPLGLDRSVASALEQIGLPAYIADCSGRMLWVNRAGAELIGGDVTGLHFSRIVAPEHVGIAERALAQKLSGGAEVTDFTVDLLALDGRRIPVDVKSVVLRDGGRVVGVLGMGFRASGRAVPAPQPAPLVHLTARQRQVLDMLGRGLSTKEIARELSISTETARNHIRAVLRELGARSRLEAIVKAHRLGLLKLFEDEGRPA